MIIKRFEDLEIWQEARGRGYCGEVRSQSYRAFDWNYIVEQDFDELLERTEKLSRKTINLMHHLKISPNKGSKYS